MNKIDIIYLEESLDGVIDYFVKGYKNEEITRHEYFIDTAKNKVVLKLFRKVSK